MKKRRPLRIVKKSNKETPYKVPSLDKNEDGEDEYVYAENEAFITNEVNDLKNLTDAQLVDSVNVSIREIRKETLSFIDEAAEFIDATTRTPWYDDSTAAKEFVQGFRGLCDTARTAIEQIDESTKRPEETDDDYLFRVMYLSGEAVDVQSQVDTIYDLMNVLQANICNKEGK